MKYESGDKECQDMCIPDCNDIRYTISTERTLLDPANTICKDPRNRSSGKDDNTVGTAIWNHIFGQPISNVWYNNQPYSWIKETPTNELIRLIQDASMNPNESLTQIEYCKGKVTMDIAIVNVVVNSPSVLTLVQNVRVTFSDMLANFGEYLLNFQYHSDSYK